MESFLRDLRHGLRTLARNPAVTAVAVLTLALGIGANSTIFSVVYAVLLRPLPVHDVDRVVTIALNNQRLAASGAQPGFRSYARWTEYRDLFQSIAAASTGTAEMQEGATSQPVKLWRVTAGFLPTLGVRPTMGRNFSEAEDQPGGAPVALVSHEFWRSRLGGNPGVLGAGIQLDRKSYTIVGVLPSGFHVDGRPAEVYIPIARSLSNTDALAVNVYARLKPGIETGPATAKMDTLAREADKGNFGWRPRVWKLRDFQVRDVRLSLWLLLGAVGLVLLIACANTASLLLARANARRKELAVRAALGAGRRRLLRQLLTESTLLALLGAACGIVVAALSIRLVPLLMHERLPGLLEQTRIDTAVLLFTVVLALITGLLFGGAPAWTITRAGAAESLRDGVQAGRGRRGRRSSRLLVIAETAIALVLAIGATLLIRSFFYLRDVAPGFRVDNLVAASINSEKGRFATPEQVIQHYSQIVERVRAIPGVQSATFASALPLSGDNWVMSAPIEGQSYATPREWPMLFHRTVDEQFFRTMQIPLLRGRLFGPQDHRSSQKVAIVSDTMARRFWPGQDPVGKRFGEKHDWEVIGVTADVRHQDSTQEPPPEVYFSYSQSPTARVTLAIRTDPRVYGSPLRLEPALRAAIAALDQKQALTKVAEVRQVISDRVATKRLSAQFIGVFAGLALMLAAVGVYGVLSFSVSQRTHEMGVRMAMGAQPGALVRMVILQAGAPAGVGVAIGIGAAVALSRLMTKLLYGVSPTDPWIYAAAAAAIMAVALIAAFVPALRAARVDPLLALRHE